MTKKKSFIKLKLESYLAQWIQLNEEHFPSKGSRVTVWCHDIDPTTDLENLRRLSRKLSEEVEIVDDVDAWFDKFVDYAQLPSSSLEAWSRSHKRLYSVAFPLS